MAAFLVRLSTTTVLLLSLAVTIYSCKAGRPLNKGDYYSINKDFSGAFKNKSYESMGSGDSTILNFFEISATLSSDTITLSFDSIGNLNVQFQDAGKARTKKFKGKFSEKGGYFTVYIERNIKRGFLLNHRTIDRLRIAQTQDNNLIIENWYQDSGSALIILAAGHSYRKIGFYERL
jgi:hypothetical protein